MGRRKTRVSAPRADGRLGCGGRVCGVGCGCLSLGAGWCGRASGFHRAARKGSQAGAAAFPVGAQRGKRLVGDRAAYRVERGDEGQPQRISIGEVGCDAHQVADRVVGAQQRPQFLFGAAGVFDRRTTPSPLSWDVNALNAIVLPSRSASERGRARQARRSERCPGPAGSSAARRSRCGARRRRAGGTPPPEP